MKINIGDRIVDTFVTLLQVWLFLTSIVIYIIVCSKVILMVSGSTVNKTQNTINSGNMILLTSDSGSNIRGTEYVDTETGVHYIVWFDEELGTSAIGVRYGSTGEVIKEVVDSD